jgi:hypothetical protein
MLEPGNWQNSPVGTVCAKIFSGHHIWGVRGAFPTVDSLWIKYFLLSRFVPLPKRSSADFRRVAALHNRSSCANPSRICDETSLQNVIFPLA